MRLAVLATMLAALACPAARAQEQRGDRAFGQVVTIEISGVVDEIQSAEITRRVPQLMNPGEYITRFSTGSGGILIARVAPIPDVKALAAKIDFGKVTKIDGRTISVQAHPVPGAGTEAASPLSRALAGLKSRSADLRCSSLEQLAEMKPTKRRGEVVQALEAQLGTSDSRVRARAIKALGVWGTKEHVPVLLPVLNSPEGDARWAAIEALGKLKDPVAIEPIARRLAHASDQSEAVEALVTFGPAAEQAALRVLASNSSTARTGACKVLEKVGTKQSLAALEKATHDSDNWVESAANRALKSVKRRT